MEDRAKTARRNNAPHKAIVRKKDGDGREGRRARRALGMTGRERIARHVDWLGGRGCFSETHASSGDTSGLVASPTRGEARFFGKKPYVSLERKYISKNSLAEAKSHPRSSAQISFFAKFSWQNRSRPSRVAPHKGGPAKEHPPSTTPRWAIETFFPENSKQILYHGKDFQFRGNPGPRACP